ncbi:MAG: hypothetical protein HUJ73_00260 [Eubacterium sp.]|nr:hypothetical protein [Eubacterium sp.]
MRKGKKRFIVVISLMMIVMTMVWGLPMTAIAGAEITPTPTETTDPTKTTEPTKSTDPAKTADPTKNSDSTVTPKPTENTDPAETQKPTENTEPAETQKPTENTDPAETQKPTENTDPAGTPEQTENTDPAGTPEQTEDTDPAETPEPTEDTDSAETPEPTETAEPTKNTDSAGIPEPTENTDPTVTPEPTVTPTPTPEPPKVDLVSYKMEKCNDLQTNYVISVSAIGSLNLSKDRKQIYSDISYEYFYYGNMAIRIAETTEEVNRAYDEALNNLKMCYDEAEAEANLPVAIEDAKKALSEKGVEASGFIENLNLSEESKGIYLGRIANCVDAGKGWLDEKATIEEVNNELALTASDIERICNEAANEAEMNALKDDAKNFLANYENEKHAAIDALNLSGERKNYYWTESANCLAEGCEAIQNAETIENVDEAVYAAIANMDAVYDAALAESQIVSDPTAAPEPVVSPDPPGFDPEDMDVADDAEADEAESDPVPEEHMVIDGNGATHTLGTSDQLYFRFTGDADKVIGVAVDGAAVNASISAGSTIVALPADVLNKLSAGNHTLTVTWEDGSADASFTIRNADATATPTAAPADTGKKTAPQTGDSGNAVLWSVLLAAAAGAGIVICRKRREDER